MSKQIYTALLSSALMLFGAGAFAAAPAVASQGSAAQQQKPSSSNQSSKQGASDQGSKAGKETTKHAGPHVIAKLEKSQVLASTLDGMTVKNGSGKKAKEIGSVGDLIVGKKNHKVEGIVVDVGGFIGIGTKEVGIKTDAIKNIDAKKKVIVVAMTKKQLSNAPAFKDKEDQMKQKKQKKQQASQKNGKQQQQKQPQKQQ